MDIFPAWQEARLGTIEEKIAKFADPERRGGLRKRSRGRAAGSASPLPDRRDHGELDLERRPDAQELKERYEGYTIGEIAAREGSTRSTPCSTSPWPAELKVGFGTTMIEMDPQAVKEVATSSVALPGISDGGAHTKFVTTARFATELLGHWVREHEIMSLEEAHWRLSAYPARPLGLKDRGFLGEGSAGRRHRLRPRHRRRPAAGAAVRLSRGRVAAGPEGDGLRPHHRQRCDDLHRRRVHRRDARPPAAARHRLRPGSDDQRATTRSRPSSTPTTTTGRPATRSPGTATRSSSTGACGRRRSTDARYVLHGERLHPLSRVRGRAPAAEARLALRLLHRQERQAGVVNEPPCEDPSDHPEWFDRDARLGVMDDQGVEATWLFPSQGVCMEVRCADIEAAIEIFRGSTVDRRRVGLRLPGPNLRRPVPHAVRSRQRSRRARVGASTAGARVVAIRHGPVFTADGLRSPADPVFDPFWARVAEAGCRGGPHAGFDDGYPVAQAVAEPWGRAARVARSVSPLPSTHGHQRR